MSSGVATTIKGDSRTGNTIGGCCVGQVRGLRDSQLSWLRMALLRHSNRNIREDGGAGSAPQGIFLKKVIWLVSKKKMAHVFTLLLLTTPLALSAPCGFQYNAGVSYDLTPLMISSGSSYRVCCIPFIFCRCG